MEIPQTFNEFKVWTDDFIIPNDINLKTIINNNNPSTSPLFLIEIRIQEFVQYLSKKGDSIEEEPRGPFMVESFYLPSNAMIDDSLCEILSSIVNSWDPTPRGATVEHKRIKDESVCLTPFLGIRYKPSNIGFSILTYVAACINGVLVIIDRFGNENLVWKLQNMSPPLDLDST
ncbi:hypothetical protein H5410_028299 [Solanum commersonii]|uniref:Uncharacterized protein n=1 Tax=Solanum commersonii TaxID=4109 RepID=A0A9J5Z4I9_SOLCO|nr:hypothetical protein H5410_028299 [Solanum commersonii]